MVRVCRCWRLGFVVGEGGGGRLVFFFFLLKWALVCLGLVAKGLVDGLLGLG